MDSSWPQNGNSDLETKSEVNFAENNENNMKNISPYMSKDLIAAAGFNVETPIVTAIIGNLTGTLRRKKNETEMVKCEICDCELSSNIVLSLHVNGSRHKKRLKALEIIEQLKDAKDKGVQLGDSDNPNAFRCEICSMTVNSAQQLEIHLAGAKHKKKAAKTELEPNDLNKISETSENTDNNTNPPVAKKKKKNEPKIIPCDTCNVVMNSQTQYDQHLISKKHLYKASGIQQKRKPTGKEKFIRFPQFRSGGTQFAMNKSICMNQNQSNQYSSQIYRKMSSQSNFITKGPFSNSCNIGVNTNSFRQPMSSQYHVKY